jgi:hypothetical protein
VLKQISPSEATKNMADKWRELMEGYERS